MQGDTEKKCAERSSLWIPALHELTPLMEKHNVASWIKDSENMYKKQFTF